ncbi:MAG: class I SAM-dependent methyltransferase [Armatimonadota bacterium]
MFRWPTTITGIAIGDRVLNVEAVADQDALIDTVKTQHDLDHFPYGWMLWPSAIGLSTYILDNANRFARKRVLELGCGVGLAGVVAAIAGATVIQTDYLDGALELSSRNANINGVTTTTCLGDWRDFPVSLVESTDIVIGTDILYERSMHPYLKNLLPLFTKRGVPVLIADPIRPQALDALGLWEHDLFHIEHHFVDVPWDTTSKTIWIIELTEARG